MAIEYNGNAVNGIIYNDGSDHEVYKVVEDGTLVWCKKYYLDFSFVKSSTPARYLLLLCYN